LIAIINVENERNITEKAVLTVRRLETDRYGRLSRTISIKISPSTI
jgi:hypothetical protein